MRDFVINHGAKFEIILSPSAQPEMRTPAWAHAAFLLHDWAAREHVKILDMTASYSLHPADEVYLDGLHLSPLGNQLVAEAFELDDSEIGRVP